MADAEELMRLAKPGSVPWSQAMNAYTEGTMMAGRIENVPENARTLALARAWLGGHAPSA